jgi:two-component system, chemotaxis family, chemotaxis protein CheY
MAKTILVVDDSATMRQLIGLTLKKVPGCRVVEAANGAEAVTRLGGGPADLVITDINMPEMNGLELVRHVRGPLGQRDLPIIVVTTKGDDGARDAGLQAGANAYLTKPLSGALLISLVEQLTAPAGKAGVRKEG